MLAGILTIIWIIIQCFFWASIGFLCLCVVIDIICFFVSPSNSLLNDLIPSKKTWAKHQESKIEWYKYAKKVETGIPSMIIADGLMTRSLYATEQIWNSKQIKEFPTISCKQFEQFYYLNPKSWTLEDCRVYKNCDNDLSFTFEYPEWLKYRKFKAQIELEKEKKATHEQAIREMKAKDDTTRKILEAVQQDIDDIRAKAKEDIAKSMELIQEVKL